MKEGDKVIYLDGYGKKPITDNVARVTPRGWVTINSRPHLHFVHRNGDRYEPRERQSRYSAPQIYPYSDEKWAELSQKVDEAEQQALAQKAVKEKREADRQAQYDAQMETIKKLYHGNIWKEVQVVRGGPLPDGSRLYLLDVPVREDELTRKKGFEIAIVRCVDGEKWDYSEVQPVTVKVVTMYVTYCNGGSNNFSGHSGVEIKGDDESGLWEAARQCYHSW